MFNGEVLNIRHVVESLHVEDDVSDTSSIPKVS
jgi:hypothetical protein